MSKHLHIMYASTSGHTEYVVSVLAAYLREQQDEWEITEQRCDIAKAEDLLQGDALILASGTWNTGGVEGQLNPHMYDYLRKTAKELDLQEKPTGIIALGDTRYFYTARAGEHLRNFILSHNGRVLGQPLTVVNEPYGQEERVHKWAEKLRTWLAEL